MNYTYDVWNRLATASTTSNAWSQTYVYDGFGNLQGLNGASTSQVDSSHNQPWASGGYDANGLPRQFYSSWNYWNVENQLISQSTNAAGATPTIWTYDPYGKRVRKSANPASDGTAQPEIYFYGITGQKLATFTSQWDTVSQTLSWSSAGIDLYFAGRMLRAKGTTVATDRLGSVRSSQGNPMRYLPYGQEITSAPDNQTKFATYFRDATAAPQTQGQDYADQRYYNQTGSFWTPDPGGLTSVDPKEPASWNRYAYTNGDPVNNWDPPGMSSSCPVDTCITVTAATGFIPFNIFIASSAPIPPQPKTNDPLPLTGSQELAMIAQLRQLVKNGRENDCNALADYIDAVAQGVDGSKTAPQQIKKAMSLLTPTGFPEFLTPGVSGNANYQPINNGSSPSGFQAQFQDQIPNADQVHHFAAFFQFGFTYGASAAATVASAYEKWEGTPNNVGDINLGVAAGLIGSYVASGVLPVSEVAETIRFSLCKPQQ